MNARVVAFVVGGLVALLGLGGGLWFLSLERPPRLQGRVTAVRTAPAEGGVTLVVAEFEARNTTDRPVRLWEVKPQLEGADGQVTEGAVMADVDATRLIPHFPALGAKRVRSVPLGETWPAGQLQSRMVLAQFAFPEEVVRARKAVRVVLVDADGRTVALREGAVQP